MKRTLHLVIESDSQSLPLPWCHKNELMHTDLFTTIWKTYPYVARYLINDDIDTVVSVNASRGGTIEGAFLRSKYVIRWSSPDVIIFNHGIVDSWLRAGSTRISLPEFSELFRRWLWEWHESSPKAELIVLGICNTSRKKHIMNPGLTNSIMKFDNALRSITPSNAFFIDTQAIQTSVGPSFLHPDGHHFGADGHNAIGSEIARIIKTLL